MIHQPPSPPRPQPLPLFPFPTTAAKSAADISPVVSDIVLSPLSCLFPLMHLWILLFVPVPEGSIDLVCLLGVLVHLLLADPSAVYQVLDHLLWVAVKGPAKFFKPPDHRVALVLFPVLLV
jgi:hypothetical protein